MFTKKNLLSLFVPVIITIPLTLSSCSSNDEQKINEAKDKVKAIAALKLLPTFKSTTPTPINPLELKITDFSNPPLPTGYSPNDFTIEVWSIELPILGSKNLDIWLKVTSTSTSEIYPDISEFYSIESTNIKELEETKVIEVGEESLKPKFEELVLGNKSLITTMINEAILGIGYFENNSSIDIQKLKDKDVEEIISLDKRLVSDNTNKFVFEGRQKNVYFNFVKFEGEAILLNCILNDEKVVGTSGIIIELPFEGIDQGGV